MPGPKPGALPLGDVPIDFKQQTDVRTSVAAESIILNPLLDSQGWYDRDMKQPRGKKILWLAVALLIVLTGVYFYFFRDATRSKPAKSAASRTTPAVSSAAHPNRIRVLAAGDFIAHDTINQAALQPDGSYNYIPMMSNFSDIFHAADIRFCNDANLNGGASYGISGWPKFNSPTEFTRDMGKVGCNLVSDGTNHSFDRNQDAINASIDAWNTVPNMLAVVGQNKNMAEHDAVHYFTVKGVKFAFLAYTTYLNTDAPAQNNYGVNVYSDAFAKQQIDTAKANGAQIIIASVRWGVEYSTTVSDSQKQTAQFLADQGVSLILGHGSHELEPVQTLTGSAGNKTVVWYSLGDFINTQLPPETLFNGLAVIDYDKNTKQITDMSFLPIYMHYEWTAQEAARQNDADLLARHNLQMYLLEDTTQAMVDDQQLKTTLAAQRERIQNTLNTDEQIPLVTKAEYDK